MPQRGMACFTFLSLLVRERKHGEGRKAEEMGGKEREMNRNERRVEEEREEGRGDPQFTFLAMPLPPLHTHSPMNTQSLLELNKKILRLFQ